LKAGDLEIDLASRRATATTTVWIVRRSAAAMGLAVTSVIVAAAAGADEYRLSLVDRFARRFGRPLPSFC
jgi:hypothetical protein